MLGSNVPRVWLSRRLLRNLPTWRRKLPNSFRSPFFKHEWLTHSDTWRNKHSCSPLECLARPFQHHRQTSGSPLRPCLQRIVASTGTLHERKAVRGLGQNIFPFLTLQYVQYFFDIHMPTNRYPLAISFMRFLPPVLYWITVSYRKS